MRLDTGFNVLTLPFEVNTLTIGPLSQDISCWKSRLQIFMLWPENLSHDRECSFLLIFRL